MTYVAPVPTTAAMGTLCLNANARARMTALRACVAGFRETDPDMTLSAARGPRTAMSLWRTLSRAALFRRSGAAAAASICARAVSLSSLTREVIHAMPAAGDGVDAPNDDVKPRATLTSPRAFFVTNDAGFGRIAGDAMSEATARRAEDDDDILACSRASSAGRQCASNGTGSRVS